MRGTVDPHDMDFNPRSREGSDSPRCAELPPEYISIHAPARGATDIGQPGGEITQISIHAPARGATHTNIQRIGDH